MTVYSEHRVIGSRRILGIAPHRIMSVRKSWSPSMSVGRRNVNMRIMWRIDQFLSKLRNAGRKSICIIDNACGDGRLLIRAAQRARHKGFVAIDARGFDESINRVAVARAAGLAWRDPAVGFDFSVRPHGTQMPVEDAEADLLLAKDGEDARAEIARVTDPDGSVIRHD